MKLLTKNTIVVLCVTLAVFLAGGFVFYFQLRAILDEEANEELYVQKNRLLEYIAINNKLPEPFGTGFSFRASSNPAENIYTDTIMVVPEEDGEEEALPFRQLFFKATHDGHNYQGVVRKSLIESEDLTETITNSLLVITAILIVVLLAVNFLFSRLTWKPFFRTLRAISGYKPGKQEIIRGEKTSTTEFSQLAAAIETMTEKIAADFNNLKAFTENAAHELQTPLAIIQHKTELLLQNETLSETQTQQLVTIRTTAVRLGKLTQALLLLTKIENNQFLAGSPVNFSEILQQRFTELQELLELKNLVVKTSIAPAVNVLLHPVLADVIITNLIGNALKYSEPGGQVIIGLTADAFRVCNTATAPIENPASLFQRFYKEQSSSDSTGLGLALVHQIAVMNGHTIVYGKETGLHVFTYRFS